MSVKPVLLSSKTLRFGEFDIVFQGRYTTVRDVCITTCEPHINVKPGTVIRVEKIEEDHIVFRFYHVESRKFVEFRADQELINTLFIS
jgi:hypothetical protein